MSTRRVGRVASLFRWHTAHHVCFPPLCVLFDVCARLCVRSLRCVYSTLIAVDLFESSHHDVEQLLWKSCIYKQIESLRKIMRTVTPTAQPTSRRYAQQLTRFAKLCAFVRAVLKECMAFYERLFFTHLPLTGWEAVARTKLQLHTSRSDGTRVDDDDAPAVGSIDSSDEETPVDRASSMPLQQHQQQPSIPRPRLSHIQLRPFPSSAFSTLSSDPAPRQLYLNSCHRCLIFRGDLERYYLLMLHDETAIKWIAEHRRVNAAQLQQGPSLPLAAAASQQWHRVRRFYLLAIALLPDVGNPFNQLAVLNTYEHAPLAAVYHYFRALSAAMPFPTAKLNVELLLEKRRDASLLQAHARQHGANATESSALFPGRDACAFLRDNHCPMDTLWVQLFDLLFNKQPHPHAHALPCVAAAALHRFAAFVSQPAAQPSSTCSSSPSRSVYALRLLLSLLHCAHHTRSIDAASSASQHAASRDPNSMCDDEPGDGATSSAAPLSLHTTSLALCCELVTLLMASVSLPRSGRIGVVCAFLAWLQIHPRSLDEAAVPVPVQQAFFRSLALLLNMTAKFMAPERSHDANAQGQEDSADGEALFEEAEVRGCSLFLRPSSQDAALAHSSSSSSSGASPLLGQPTSAVASEAPEDDSAADLDGDDTHQPHPASSPAERRCARLLRFGSWMTARGVGVARDHAASGGFRAMHDPVPSGLAAGAASTDEDAAAASAAAAPLPVAPLASLPTVPVFPQTAHSATLDRVAHASPPITALPASPPRNRDPSQLSAAAVSVAVPSHSSAAPPCDHGPAANGASAGALSVQHSVSYGDASDDDDCAMSDHHNPADEQTSAPANGSNAPLATASAAAPAPAVLVASVVEHSWSVSGAARSAGLDLAASYTRVMFPSFASSFAGPPVPFAVGPAVAR